MQSSRQTMLPRWCVLFALLIVRPAAAESPPPLEWLREGVLQVTWPQGGQAQPAKVQVLNRSSSPQEVQVELIPVDSSPAETAASNLNITPSKATLDPGKAVTFTISAQSDAKPKPATYESVLVAYSNVPGSSIRRDVQLTVPAEKPPPSERFLKFLVTAIELRTYRCPRWGPWCLCQCPCWGDPLDDSEVPANIGAEGNWNPPKAYLATASGATADLSLPPPEPLTDGFHGVKVKVDDIDRVGTYSGKLTAGTGNDGQVVNVTLTVAHPPLFAIVAVCGGILLALWIQRYMSVLRLTLALAAREAEMGRDFENAQNTFAAKTTGKSFASYTLSDFERRREALRDKIAALQRSVFTSLDTTNPKYLEIDAELKVLETVPEQWEAFAPTLFNLEDAFEEVDWRQVIPSAYLEPAPKHPATCERMRQLLAGTAITVQQFGERFTEVSKGPDLLTAWQALNRRAAALHASLASLKKEAEKAKLTILEIATAEAALVPIWNRLWSYADVDLAAQAGLDTVENQLAIVRTLVLETGVEKVLDFAPAALPASVDVVAILRRITVAPIQQPVSDIERLRLLHQRQRLSAWAVALVGFLIALYSGMKQFYIGKPFGYWLDYVEIVAWAVAAQSVLEMLLRGLDRIWGLGGLFRGRAT